MLTLTETHLSYSQKAEVVCGIVRFVVPVPNQLLPICTSENSQKAVINKCDKYFCYIFKLNIDLHDLCKLESHFHIRTHFQLESVISTNNSSQKFYKGSHFNSEVGWGLTQKLFLCCWQGPSSSSILVCPRYWASEIIMKIVELQIW